MQEIDNIHKDYSRFSFEEFLLDDFFIKSVKSPTETSLLFWEKFRGENQENLKNYNAAKRFVEDTCKDLLDDNTIDKIWTNIRKRNRKVKKIKRMGYIGIVAAVSIVFLFVFRFYFTSQDDEKQIPQDIISFANRQIPATPSSDIQLILSDDKVISLSETESVITYDSASIKISSQEVSKKEAASFSQLITPAGRRSMLTLTDGTKIWVNSGTKLVYPVEFEEHKREIYIDGEIYIDVASDAKRPFIVRTNDMEIRVLGTKFNVQAYASDNQRRVVLETGSVKILPGKDSKEVQLYPDKMYEYDHGVESVRDVDINKYTSWVNGLYIYDGERLNDIFTRLSRYYGKEIVIDQQSAQLRCSGKLDLKESLDDVLLIIAYTAPIVYSYTDNKYIITFKP